MTAVTTPAADLGPLTWVRPEIDKALAQGLEALGRFVSDPSNDGPLAEARTHVHQVAGAIQMVGLEGPAVFVGGIERHLAWLGGASRSDFGETAAVLERACRRLKLHLDALQNGASANALALFPEYREMAVSRGEPDASAVDLFFPDLERRAPRLRAASTGALVAVPDLQRLRRAYQHGLLAWLRGEADGARRMREAALGVEEAHGNGAARAFWWSVAALMEAVAGGGLDPTLGLKHLCGRIDLQIRRYAEGSAKVSDRLRREVLFYLAQARPVSPRIAEVRTLYGLESLLCSTEAGGQADPIEVAPRLGRMRDRLEALKEAWLKHTSDGADAAAVARAFDAMSDTFSGLQDPVLDALIEGLAQVAHAPPATGVSESLALEFATGLLLVERAIEHLTRPSPDLPRQVAAMRLRLEAALEGREAPVEAQEVALLDEFARRAQERLLLAQVAREVQANLRTVESGLDAFFRDPSHRGQLTALLPHLKQVRGALTMLGLDRARDVTAACERRVRDWAGGVENGTTQDFESLAESLSALGFYLDAVEGQRPDAESMLGGVEADPPPEAFAPEQGPADVAASAEPVSARQRGEPAPGTGLESDDTQASEPEPARPPQADPELQGIFIDEAREVLADMREQLPRLLEEDSGREALRTVRRGFHTLKGSGRMVGLGDLGEAAWDVERLLNGWLEEDRPVVPALAGALETAVSCFGEWIEGLTGKAEKGIDASVLRAALAPLEGREPGPQTRAGDAAQAPEPAFAGPAADETPQQSQVHEELLGILIEEAVGHLGVLRGELSQLRADPHLKPTEEMVRASHTLCGIHRTGGFPLVADAAASLERTLEALRAAGRDFPGGADLLDQAVGLLDTLCGQVGTRGTFGEGDRTQVMQVQAELDALARQARASSAAAPDTTEPAQDPGGPADPLAGVADDLDRDLLPLFLEEAQELFPRAGAQLRTWRSDPGEAQRARELQRTLHTFKGAARMAGAMRLGELAHRMESRVPAGEDFCAPPPAVFEALETDLDQVTLLLEQLQSGGTADVPETPDSAAAARETSAADVRREDPEAVVAAAVPTPPAAQHSPDAGPVPTPDSAHEAGVALHAEPVAESDAARHAMLRVRADVVDRLVNEAGEIVISRSRIEGELRAVRASMTELTTSVMRLRSQVREVEMQAESQIQSRLSQVQGSHEGFDPLEFDRYSRLQELTRGLAEAVNDVAVIQQALIKNLGEADTGLSAQARLTRDLHQQLLAVRTVPFGRLSERLYRVLRRTARELHKKANLELRGTQVEVDRSVLERLVGPLEHLLRNAVDHGLESAQQRSAAGKREAGEIVLQARQEGQEIAIAISDDGRGLDLERVRAHARARGLLEAGEQIDEATLTDCIFAPGLSTASEVTRISGRGVGLDVVRSEIVALGGRIEVESKAGRGTTFTMYLPLSLAVTQAVLVRAGGRLLAVPAAMVEQVAQVRGDDLPGVYERGALPAGGRSVPFHYLPHLLGEPGLRPEAKRHNAVLMARSGPSVAAVHVDEIVGNQEIVVKSLGTQLDRVAGITGATVLGNGEIVLILNPVQLSQRAAAQPRSPMIAPVPMDAAVAERPRLVMVVDDSLTVRKITGRLLAREGYEVVTAKDGLDALQVLGERRPDLMLLDIEMPRMDGFELAKTVKSDPRLRAIPIIIVTSRTAEKHRSRARELGVEGYLGKPYQEHELLAHVRAQVSGQREEAALKSLSVTSRAAAWSTTGAG